MEHFKQSGPTGPFEADKRLDVRVNQDTAAVEVVIDGRVVTLTEAEGRRFSVAFWTACNDAQVISHNLGKRRKSKCLV